MKREDLIELAKQQAAEIARAGHNGWGNTMLALAATLESSAPVEVEDKARAMFEAQADKLTAPWDRQWEPTKGFWRKRAAEALAQQPAACTACNGRGEVGGATPEGFETHPCPECEQQPAAVDKADKIKDVHTEHCCAQHGCKYADSDCPVASGNKPQSYPCESCEWGKEDAALAQQPAAVDEATRRDAERYRWLRDNAGAWEVSRDPGEWTKCDTGEKYKPRVYFTAFGTGYGGMFLDDAIDAAMTRANT